MFENKMKIMDIKTRHKKKKKWNKYITKILRVHLMCMRAQRIQISSHELNMVCIVRIKHFTHQVTLTSTLLVHVNITGQSTGYPLLHTQSIMGPSA